MLVEKLTTNIKAHGFYNYGLYLGLRLAQRITYTAVLVGMTLTPESLDPRFLEADDKYESRFATADELKEYAADPENDLPADFLDVALAKEDSCYAILDGDRLASYGWYTNTATLFTPGLDLVFDRSWTYMYRGFTHPAYRGQRLHAIGMARAMQHFAENGSRGLISYVHASNFSSLRSVYRMGYRTIGKIIVVRVPGRFVVWTTGQCKQHGLTVAPTSPPHSA